ncbi:hypothetical protein AGMMS49574_15130 [Bacteroidia bacterium]|nr:hypothetical protein AGMMS49574_15130 [Bacteroidia bacterium]
MKIRVKWIVRLCLIPVVPTLVMAVLLYVPPFQNYLFKKVIRYAGKQADLNIDAEHVRLVFPLDLKVSGLVVQTSTADTLFSLEALTLKVQPIYLFRKIVYVENLDLQQLKLHTGSLIDNVRVDGELSSLSAKADIRLENEKANLYNLMLSDADVHILIADTSKSEPSVPLQWKIDLDKIALNRVRLALQMPADTLSLSAYIGVAELTKGEVDLGEEQYTAEAFRLADSELRYDGNDISPAGGNAARHVSTHFDPQHIDLSHLNALLGQLLYHKDDMHASINYFSTRDRSGLAISSLTGSIGADNVHLAIPYLLLVTPYSNMSLEVNIPFNALSKHPDGETKVNLTASIGKNDLLFMDGLPANFAKVYPDKPLLIVAKADGNAGIIKLTTLSAEMSEVFHLKASGSGDNLLDSIRRTGHFEMKSHVSKPGTILGLLPKSVQEGIRTPGSLNLTGNIGLQNQDYKADLLLTEAHAKVKLKGFYNVGNECYEASLTIDSLEPSHFLANDSLSRLTANFSVEGKGTDIYAKSTEANWSGKIDDLQYGASKIGDITLGASLQNHQVKVSVKSDLPDAKLDFAFDGTLEQKKLTGMLTGDVDSLNLYALHLMDTPFTTSFNLFAEVESDLKIDHHVDVTLGNWDLTLADRPINPQTLILHTQSEKDTTRLSFHAGDLGLTLTGNAGLETMSSQFQRISEDVANQLKQDSAINIAALRPYLPDMTLSIHAEKDNPLYTILKQYKLDFGRLSVEAATSPEEGVRLDASVYALNRDTFRIDTIRAIIRPEIDGLIYDAQVVKNRYMHQTAFTAGLKGCIGYRYLDAEAFYTNNEKETGLHLGISGVRGREGIDLRLFPDNPIIAFNTYSLNPDNFIHLKSMKEIEANVRLTGANNNSLWFHSLDGADAQYPELHAELSQIPIGLISKGFAELPDMKGMLSADLQYAPSKESFMVVADVNIDNLIYEGSEVGELMLNTVYLPIEQDVHQVDMHFSRGRDEVGSATVIYNSKKENIDGGLSLEALPLDMFTPFIPDNMASLNGSLSGEMDIKGPLTKPLVEGYLKADTASVYSGLVASRFRLDDKKIFIKNNRLNLDTFQILASGTNPFVIDGNIDFSNFSNIMADLQMKGNRLQLLDAKRTPDAIAYGKLLVNTSSTVKGPLSALTVRGNINLLGGTNLTYVMKDSPLTVQDRLKDLVTFTSFADTTLRMRRNSTLPPLPLGGMDVLMVLHIDPIVNLQADINPDQSSYVSLEGGGDLSFQYTRQGQMLLNGRYTLSNGKMKYALPIIPLKEFTVKPNSFIQWDGDPMNPQLGIAATQRTRASVSLAGESPRKINFEVGVDVRERLENMALTFTIAAPEDASVQAELDKMGVEGRSTQAVGMMVTGMYLANSGDGKVNMNMGDALGSFLQSEINNIAGDALKTVDFSIGMDTYTQSAELGGGQRTDYSFSYAQRFYDDRLRLKIGGKVSSGNVQQKESFIDDVSLEWRLNRAGTGYLKLFHDKNYQSILDGEVIETGVGIVLRRKMLNLRELFKK